MPRRTCEYTSLEWDADSESHLNSVCEAPAVDFIEKSNDLTTMWVCAYHYDIIMRAKAAVKRIQQMFKAEYGY